MLAEFSMDNGGSAVVTVLCLLLLAAVAGWIAWGYFKGDL